MYCTTCGKGLVEGSNFCTSCGAEVKKRAIQMAPKDMRLAHKEHVAALERLMPIIAEASALIPRINMNRAEYDRKIKQRKFMESPWYIVVAVVAGLFITSTLCGLVKPSDNSAIKTIQVLVAGMIAATGEVIGTRLYKKSLDEKIPALCQVINADVAKFNEISEKADPRDLALLPPEYRHITAAQEIYKVLKESHTRVINKAVDIYRNRERTKIENERRRKEAAQLEARYAISDIADGLLDLAIVTHIWFR